MTNQEKQNIIGSTYTLKNHIWKKKKIYALRYAYIKMNYIKCASVYLQINISTYIYKQTNL